MIAALRSFARSILHFLLRLTEDRAVSAQTARGAANILKHEINLPPILTALASIGVFFMVLLFEVGLSWTKIVALILFLAVIYFSLLAYIKYQQPEILEDSESVMLLGFLFTSAVLFMQLLKDWHAPLATPIAAFPMLVGLLLSKRLAFITALVLAMFVGVLNDFSLEYFMVHFFGSVVGIFALAKIRNRSDIASAGLKVAGLNIVVVMIIHLFKIWPLRTLEAHLGWAAFSGFSSGLIVLGALPYLESFFSRTTNIKLLELADFNHPLLKRLMIETPGTYHHSLIMASLAEQAITTMWASLLNRIILLKTSRLLAIPTILCRRTCPAL
jgi:membrane-associated HD superfamily phosphohydrolase